MFDSVRPYEELRATGLPWATEVPAHWDLIPNRALLRRKKVLVGERYPEFRLLSLTKQGVILRDVESGKGKWSADLGTSQEVRPGELIFCLFDVPETPRTVGLSPHHGMITGAYTVFECRGGHTLARYIELYYRALDDRKLLSPLYSGLRNTIPCERLLATKTPVPPPDEQAAIVRFLDYADRRIRRYIRAKQKLIKLLEEQKQVIIHRAVTRGLDPNVRLKPSGIDWLGDIPEHWETVPNKSVFRLKRVVVGANSSEYPLLSLTKRGIILRDIDSGEGKFPASFDAYQEVDPGDLVFCLFDIDETPRTVGLSGLHGMITGAYSRFACPDIGLARWAYLFYLAMDEGKRLKPLYTGLRKVIQKSVFLNARMPLPPPEEREAILTHVDSATASIEKATGRAERETELLREYRTRLIADVVTGKLDVRAAAAALPDEPDDFEPADDADEDSAEELDDETADAGTDE